MTPQTTTPQTTSTGPRSGDDEFTPRPLPLWASVPIILLCLAGSGWIVQWYWGTRVQPEPPHLLGDVPAIVGAIDIVMGEVDR